MKLFRLFSIVALMFVFASAITAQDVPPCISFSLDYKDDTDMGLSFDINGVNFSSLGSASLFINQIDSTSMGLQIPNDGLSIKFPSPVAVVTLTAGSWGGIDLHIKAMDNGGNTVTTALISATNSLQSVTLSGADIVNVIIRGGNNEGVLVEVCADISKPPGDCASFEKQGLSMRYLVGDTFTDASISVVAEDFQFPDGTIYSSGFAEVQNGRRAGGSGNEIQVNNITLHFAVSAPSGLTLHFGEYGGTLYLSVNGDVLTFENFAELDGKIVGGVSVWVVNGLGNDTGQLLLLGSVSDFAIGGQELWIDDLCPVICGEPAKY